MIAYEELQRALARWKSRRAGAGDGSDAVPEGNAGEDAGQDTPGRGVATASNPPSDSTNELELADAEVDEA